MDPYAARKSTVTLRIIHSNGAPVKHSAVHAELTNHEFLFGTGAFFTLPLTDPSTPPEKLAFLEKVFSEWKQTFNYATLPFYLGRYEPQPDRTRQEETLRAAKLLHGEGKALKGHPLCWHTSTAPWLADMTDEQVMERSLYRIRREINAFRNDIRFWDVINEAVIMPEFINEPAGAPKMNAITRLCRKTGRVPLIKAVFDEAHAADPEAKLLINDFNTSPRYSDLVRDCLDAGVPIGAIGIQSHQHQGFWGMEKLQEVTERFSSFGLPIHFTENSFVSGHLMPREIIDLNDYVVSDWPSTEEGEARQAENLITMMDYLFRQPLVEGFTTWSFEDHQWLKAPSGLIRSDGSPKPALLQLREKLKSSWSTIAQLVTDENGCCSLEGFRGEYRLEVNGSTHSLRLTKEEKEIVIRIQ